MCLLLLMLQLPCVVFAAGLKLFEWSPGGTLAPLILPVRESETPEQAAQRYLRELSKDPGLMELFDGRVPNLALSGFRPLETSGRESRALLIANLAKDYTKKSVRIENFRNIFATGKNKSFILPMNASMGLSQNEIRELFTQIANEFPLMVAMGGDDVDPKFYKDQAIHARNTIESRDKFEIELIKSYVAQEKGFLLGVCRGSQISSVALGYQLHQDVPFQIGTKVAHANDWHDIEILNYNNPLGKLLPEGTNKLYVNSLHHQAVIYKPGGPLEIVARAHDGVVEATALKNGRGLLLQFHPELMDNLLGNKILWQVLSQKNSVMAPSCSGVF